jgi:hypothetical protein
MSVQLLDADSTLDVDDGSHDDGAQVHGDVLPELEHGGGDDTELEHGDDGAELELVRDDGAELELVRDDGAELELVRDDELLEHDEQDVIHVLLSQVPMDDVRHHEMELPHDCHLLC